MRKIKQTAQSKAKSQLGPGPSPRDSGHAMGNSFAKLSGSEIQRSENIAAAINAGFRNAAQRDEITSKLSSDPEFLRSVGFYGR
jgi:hypothetical protein